MGSLWQAWGQVDRTVGDAYFPSGGKKRPALLQAFVHFCKPLYYGVADGDRTHDNRNHNPGLYH